MLSQESKICGICCLLRAQIVPRIACHLGVQFHNDAQEPHGHILVFVTGIYLCMYFTSGTKFTLQCPLTYAFCGDCFFKATNNLIIFFTWHGSFGCSSRLGSFFTTEHMTDLNTMNAKEKMQLLYL